MGRTWIRDFDRPGVANILLIGDVDPPLPSPPRVGARNILNHPSHPLRGDVGEYRPPTPLAAAATRACFLTKFLSLGRPPTLYCWRPHFRFARKDAALTAGAVQGRRSQRGRRHNTEHKGAQPRHLIFNIPPTLPGGAGLVCIITSPPHPPQPRNQVQLKPPLPPP